LRILATKNSRNRIDARLGGGGKAAPAATAGRLMFGLENDWVWLSF